LKVGKRGVRCISFSGAHAVYLDRPHLAR